MGSDGQRWDPRRYRQAAAFVAELGEPLIDLLDPRPGERILDLGCGDGALTEKLAARGCQVVGVDASPEQVAAARARGLDARVVRAEGLAFSEAFDGVFSNAMLHWVPDAAAAVAGVHRALRPEGRFVAELGGAGNIAAVVQALEGALRRWGVDPGPLNPWYFPTAEDYAALLEGCGFRLRCVRLFARPTPLPGDVVEWLDVFAQVFLAAVPAREHPRLMDEVRNALAPRLRGADGTWTVDYVRLRVVADKPRRRP